MIMKRVFAFIGFTVAITLLLLNLIPFSFVKYIALSAVAGFVVSMLIKSVRKARVLPLVIGCVILACLTFMSVYTFSVSPQLALDETTQTISFSIVDIPEQNDKGEYCYVVKTNAVEDINAPQKFKMRLKSDKQLEADFYDTVTAKVKFYSIADHPLNSYGYYGDGIYLSAKADAVYDIEQNDDKPLHYEVIKLRLMIKNLLGKTFDGDIGALASSILIGDDSDLSDEVYRDFKICGVTHAIVVSGLHTSLVCLGIYFILKMLNVPKIPKVLVTVAVLFLYISLADFSKSSVRAGIMVFVLLMADLFRQKADALNSLGIAVFIMCFNPFAVTDPSAVLSVCAVLGILVIYPELSRCSENLIQPVRFILNSVFITVSVTLSMLPAMCIYFESISLVGIILNVLFIPILQIALGSVLLFVIFSKSFILAFLPMHVAEYSLKLMIKLTEVFADSFYWLRINTSSEYLLFAVAGCFIFLGLMLIINKTVAKKVTAVFITLSLTAGCVYSAVTEYKTISVKCLSSGGVIVCDRDTVIGIDINDYSDCYAVKNIFTDDKVCVLINSDKYKDELNNCFREMIVPETADYVYQADDKIKLSIINDKQYFEIDNYLFEINQNDVIINGEVINRGALYKNRSDIEFDILSHKMTVKEKRNG